VHDTVGIAWSLKISCMLCSVAHDEPIVNVASVYVLIRHIFLDDGYLTTIHAYGADMIAGLVDENWAVPVAAFVEPGVTATAAE